MRVYKSDGTFTEVVDDTAFGWSFGDIVVEDALERVEDYSREPRILSNSRNPPPKEALLDSLNVLDNLEFAEEVNEPRKIKLETIPEQTALITNQLKESLGSSIPPKEKLADIIKPCNPEAKMLLAVVFFAKYKSLIKEETAEELLKTVNLKATNFKFLLNEEETDISEEMCKEIRNYHATKEDSMLSLMMELILTDVDCNADDIITPSEHEGTAVPNFVIETSDLGNSIHSSTSSKGEHSRDHLQEANNSNILSSVGLGWEDRSIHCFLEETCEMHHQLAEIRKSFQESEMRVDKLLKEASAFRNQLRETQYLDDLIHLLNGDLEKVSSKKLPFHCFHRHKNRSIDDLELNLII